MLCVFIFCSIIYFCTCMAVLLVCLCGLCSISNSVGTFCKRGSSLRAF